jgi:hypothetical protein
MKKLILLISIFIYCKIALPQSNNVTLVSKWLNGSYSTNFNAIYSDGTYGYLALDSVLFIIDASNPTLNPSSVKALSQIIVSNKISWINVANSKAYVTMRDSGLEIIDVSNPYIPVKMGSCHTGGSAYSVKVSGNYAYVGADTAGMKVIDISNPNLPVIAGTFDLGNAHITSIDVSGNYAYLAYQAEGFHVIDISVPSNPTAVAFLNYVSADNVFVSGNHAYLNVTDTVFIINISNPLMPVQEGIIAQFLSSFNTLYIDGNYAYISDSYNSRYQIWDVSNSFAPFLVGMYSVSNLIFLGGQSIAINGSTAWFNSSDISSNSFISFDFVNVANPATPVLAGKFRQPQIRTGICSSGNYVYSGGWTPPNNEMINIFDISNAAHPTQVGTFFDTSAMSSGMASRIILSGNYLYLPATKTGPTINSYGFKIIDVSNPMNPTKVGQFNITNQSCSDIAILGSYAYVCYGSLGLVVVDVSNPSAPVQAGSLILTGGFPAGAISVSGNRAYVTDNAGQFHIIDLTNAISPVDIGSFQLAAVANDIYAEGNYAYVAVGNQGLQIVDVSVPASPVLAGYYPPASSTNAVHKQGNYVYLPGGLLF